MYQPPEVDEARIIDDRTFRPRSFYRRVGIGFLVFTVVVASVWGIVTYLFQPYAAEIAFTTALQEDLAEILDFSEPIYFLLVPDTLVGDIIANLTVPATTTDQVVWDERASLRAEIPAEAVVDTINDFPVRDTTYEFFINEASYRGVVFQMHDEVRELVYQINFQSGQDLAVPTLATRVGKEGEARFLESVTFGTPEIISTAPSLRVVEALVFGRLLGHLFPAEAAYYDSLVEEFIDRGITYGLYGPEDIAISREVARLYFEAVEQSPSFAELVEPSIITE